MWGTTPQGVPSKQAGAPALCIASWLQDHRRAHPLTLGSTKSRNSPACPQSGLRVPLTPKGIISCRHSTRNGGICHGRPGFPENTLKKSGYFAVGGLEPNRLIDLRRKRSGPIRAIRNGQERGAVLPRLLKGLMVVEPASMGIHCRLHPAARHLLIIPSPNLSSVQAGLTVAPMKPGSKTSSNDHSVLFALL